MEEQTAVLSRLGASGRRSPELDLAFFIQSIAVESPLDPETILGWYREVNRLDPRLMDAALCVAAAYFADRAWLPELPGLPGLRTFQKKQLVVTLRWALSRLGLETPTWLPAVTGVAGERRIVTEPSSRTR